jgi:hypothetical protein
VSGNEIFNEPYRVISVAADHLVVRGEQSGKVLTINNASLGTPISAQDYPVGKLIVLTDPSSKPSN